MTGESAAAPVAALVGDQPSATRALGLPPARFMDPRRTQKLLGARQSIESFVAQQRDARKIPGLAYGVVIDGELAMSGGVGVSDFDSARTVDEDTVFRIGSITKVFVALTLLTMREEGLVELDDAVTEHFASFRGVVYPHGGGRPITLADMLTHTSGLSRVGVTPFWREGEAPSREQVVQDLEGFRLSRSPGVKYEYSNLAFGLLGLLIEDVMAEPARDVITARILAPLEMTHTVWDASRIPGEHRAVAHENSDGTDEPVPRYEWTQGALETAGGLYSSVHDLARFVAWQLDAWPPRTGPDDDILRRAVSREAQTIHFAFGANEHGPRGAGWGWHVEDACFGHIVRHAGGTDGFRSAVVMLPHHGVGVIVLANTVDTQPNQIADGILERLHRTGGLTARMPVPDAALATEAASFVALYNEWDELAFRAHANASMLDNLEVAELRAEIDAAKQQLGNCTLGDVVSASAIDAAVFALVCDEGPAQLRFAARIREDAPNDWLGFRIDALTEPTAEVVAAARAVLEMRASWTDERFDEVFGPNWNLERISKFLGTNFERWGPCELGESLSTSGARRARFDLRCEGHRGELEVALMPDDDRVQSLWVRPAKDVGCPGP